RRAHARCVVRAAGLAAARHRRRDVARDRRGDSRARPAASRPHPLRRARGRRRAPRPARARARPLGGARRRRHGPGGVRRGRPRRRGRRRGAVRPRRAVLAVLAGHEALLGRQAERLNELERIEAQALREAVVLGGGAACVRHRQVPILELNRAIPIGAAVDAAAIAAWFGDDRHVICVTGERLDLAGSLAERGYTRGRAWLKFRRKGEPAPTAATDLRVSETLDADAFATATGLPRELSGFVGAPGWRHFVAWDGDEPAACGALYVEGELAWLGVGSTREAYRRRGAQSALLAARIETGRSLGARTFTCETGEDVDVSYRNILRAGFAEAYRRENWLSPQLVR